MNPMSTTASNTLILELNDDCLLEVFKSLALVDLCTAADVCNRFRLIARNHFASKSVKSDLLNVHLTKYLSKITLGPRSDAASHSNTMILTDQSLHQKFIHVSKLLRNFGDFVKCAGIYGSDWPFVNQYRCEKSIFDLIGLYCGGTLSELYLFNCHITDEIGIALRPLLRNLKMLRLFYCKHSVLFGRMLASWSPELRILLAGQDHDNRNRGNIRLDDVLRQSFPKLELLGLSKAFLANNDNLEEFLKLNPQLKAIRLVSCPEIDGRIFRSIAIHVPDIEAIHIDRVSTVNDINVRYVGQLHSLSTLKLAIHGVGLMGNYRPDDTFIPLILCEIQAANIPLQHLHLFCMKENCKMIDNIVDTIMKINLLKTLWIIGFDRLTESHVLSICKQLKELSELDLRENKIVMTADFLFDIVKYAQKLQSLQYFEDSWFYKEWLRSKYRVARFIPHLPYHIMRPDCIKTYLKMLQMAIQRKRPRLLIKLDRFNVIAANLPEKLIRKYSYVISVVFFDKFEQTRRSIQD